MPQVWEGTLLPSWKWAVVPAATFPNYMFSPGTARLVPTRSQPSSPHPLCSPLCPPNLGPLLYLLGLYLWQYPGLSLHLCAPVSGCVSV